MYYYTYISSDSKKYYIGVRQSNIHPDNDNYYGSFYDKTFKPFKKTVLSYHYTREDSLVAEIYWHNLFNVHKNSLFVNQVKQTSTKFDYDWTNKQFSKKHKENLSKAALKRYKNNDHPWKGRKHSKESREKMSESLKGINSPWFGRKHTKDTKEKQKLARINQTKGNKNFTIYTFFNLGSKETFVGTPSDFYKKYNLHKSSVGKLVKNKQKTVKKWVVK